MKNKQINFSIIVPVYNVEKYVNKSLDSIYQAADDDCEIIIVNDGSKDKSLKIAEDFVKNLDDKILKKQTKIINISKNKGLANTKNVGIENSSGRFISFVDSDDTIDENFYSEARKYIDEYDMIVYDMYADYEGHPEYNHIIHVKREDIKGSDSAKFIHGAMQGSSSNKIIKRELYKYKFPFGKEYEDVAVTPFILVDSKRIKYIQNPYYKYLQRKTSIVGKNKWDEAYYKICENINNAFLDIDEKKFNTYIDIINEFYFYRIIDSFDFSLKNNKKNIKNIVKEFIDKNNYVINKIHDYLESGKQLPKKLTKNQKKFERKLFHCLYLKDYKGCVKLLKMRRWLNYFRGILGGLKHLIKSIFGGPYYA